MATRRCRASNQKAMASPVRLIRADAQRQGLQKCHHRFREPIKNEVHQRKQILRTQSRKSSAPLTMLISTRMNRIGRSRRSSFGKRTASFCVVMMIPPAASCRD